MNVLNKISVLIIVALGSVFLASCEKDIAGYEQDPRLYFFERANDLNKTRISERTYTFLTLDKEELKDTIYIKVKTMGQVYDYDRYTIGETLTEGSTAIEGTDYDFIPGLVPAGEVEGYIAIVLYRTERLKSETLVLNLQVGESADFKAGVVEDELFTVRWSDRLVQPDTWPYYFGAYSDVKYQFVIDELGIADFPAQLSPRLEPQPGEFSIADLQDMASTLRIRLREVNAANEGKPNYPLSDEHGVAISF